MKEWVVLRAMPSLAGLLGCALALSGNQGVFGRVQEEVSAPGEQVPPEAHSAQLHPNAFLDPSALLEWYENCLENLFDRDEEVQATAVQAIQQLAGPIEFPHEYIVVSAEDESIPKQAVRASQLTVETTETQELLANVLDRSSKGSVAEAAFILGVLSATGVSPVVEQNDAYATKMYSLAADYGSISGHLALAHRYEQGFNVPKSCSIAYGHLKIAAVTFAHQADAEQSYPQKPRQVLLRERLRTAAYTSDAEHLFSAEMLTLEQELADRGDEHAQQRLAFRQLLGLGVEPNVNDAVRVFEGAAQAGNANAMLNLGLLHTQGINGVSNHTRAHELFSAASQEDLPAAWNGLGHLYLNGLGVEANATLATYYFEKGASHGDADALYNLALIYMYGMGEMPVNATRAQLLLKDAHHMQQIKAPLLLAELHAEFDDLPGGRDCNLAMQYLWVFVDERSDWSEASFDALEMATGIQQDGGSSDLAGKGYGAHDNTHEALPHDPRRAVLLYTILAEQGSLAASINAAWLLERSDNSEYGGRRDNLIRYMYTRAALADSSHAQIDYANWLLKTAVAEKQEDVVHADGGSSSQEAQGLVGGRMESRGAPQLPGGRPPSSPSAASATVADSDEKWAVLLRVGLSGGKLHQEAGAIEQARLLYARARKLDDPEAATNLAWMHAAGIGVPRNVTAAIEECRTAIRIASIEAEKLAPRVALIALNVWAFLQRLLPDGMEAAFDEALGNVASSLIQALSTSMDQIDAATAPLTTAWNQWVQL